MQHPITALMLARVDEDERARALVREQRRLVANQARVARRQSAPPSIGLRLARVMRLAGT